MGWGFWRNKRKTVNKQLLELMIEQKTLMNNKFSIIEGYLQKYDEKFEEIDQQIDNSEDLIEKDLRLQYKYSQEILKNLEREDKIIDKIENYSKKYMEIENERDRLSKDKSYILERYIQWLDDIDLVHHNVNTEGQESWIQLLQNWQMQILKSLEFVGIYEMDILGKSFNYAFAESVGTREKEDSKEYMLYEVVEILQRGFMYEDGTLLRKAKVTTIEEEGEK